ncbi:SRPBCC family protein [Poriferisphaera sp. WC338]|uniref:SRPBCC family protein n=1 Tax=Poriferisphaera sp. WC338 TaxID=3425129 RepID=UPI003D8187D9
MLELGDIVTWQATHFGIQQAFTSKITAMDTPHFMQDTMTEGAFKSYVHDHHFESSADNQTRMTDVIRYEIPMWAIGRLAGAAFMDKYLTELIQSRCNAIKAHAES